MKQQSLDTIFGRPPKTLAVQNGRLEVFDFFCGAGGFSEGARAAGCSVVYACDNNEDALETHRRNHPDAQHVCASLPIESIPFPTDGRRFHVHGSPPCQKLSVCNQRDATSDAVLKATNMVDWFVRMALASGAESWTMEEVASAELTSVLENVKKEFKGKVAYDTFKCEELGIPQMRKRLVAGTPALIAKLQRLRHRFPKRTVRDVIAKPRGTHLRGTKSCVGMRKKANPQPGEAKFTYTKAGMGDNCVSIDRPSPTLPTHGVTWITKEQGKKAHSRIPLNKKEYAAIQTFPANYKWPPGEKIARRQIGNAVPPFLAELILRPEGEVSAPRCASPSLVLCPE